MPKVMAILMLIILAGCSTMQSTANSGADDASGVQVLTDYPKGPFKKLGVIPFLYNHPGLFEPTLEDALPQLKAKVKEMGGNALIVRHQAQPKRKQIAILAEALSIKK